MDKKNCPSAPFKKGHSIFAVFEDQTFKFTEDLIKIDEEIAREAANLENKTNYRATMPCVTKGCGNWDGQKCTVPDQMRQYLAPIEDVQNYRNCPIKSTCRWHAQEGERACQICPLIKTRFFDLQVNDQVQF
jgi:hypothetical protein